MSDQLDDQIEALIREIAQKHGIVVGRDDPIFVLQTMNNRLMQDSAKAQRAQVDRLKEELEVVAQRWSLDVRDKSERILNAALAGARESTASIMEEGARTSARACRSEVEAMLAALARSVTEARRLVVFNVAASCITLLAAGIALWATLR